MSNSVQTNAELKKLRSMLATTQAEKNVIAEEKGFVQTKWNTICNEVSHLENKIRAIEDNAEKTVVVTEHALLRYCEHVLGIDLEAAKEDILGSTNIENIRFLNGNLEIKRPDYRAILKNYNVVTVIPKD